jgi:hypothetical protein
VKLKLPIYFNPTRDDYKNLFLCFQDYRNCFSREGSNFSSTPSSYNSNEYLPTDNSTPPSPNPPVAIPAGHMTRQIIQRAVHGDDSPGLARSFSPPGISIPRSRKNRNEYPSSAPCSASNSPGSGLFMGQASPKAHNRLTISRSNSIPGIGSQSSLYGKNLLTYFCGVYIYFKSYL